MQLKINYRLNKNIKLFTCILNIDFFFLQNQLHWRRNTAASVNSRTEPMGKQISRTMENLIKNAENRGSSPGKKLSSVSNSS